MNNKFSHSTFSLGQRLRAEGEGYSVNGIVSSLHVKYRETPMETTVVCLRLDEPLFGSSSLLVQANNTRTTLTPVTPE